MAEKYDNDIYDNDKLEDVEIDESYINEAHYNEVFSNRKERYLEQKEEYHDDKKMPIGWAIAIIVFIFVYFMTFFILRLLNVLSLLGMTIAIVPMALVGILAYVFYRARRNSD